MAWQQKYQLDSQYCEHGQHWLLVYSQSCKAYSDSSARPSFAVHKYGTGYCTHSLGDRNKFSVPAKQDHHNSISSDSKLDWRGEPWFLMGRSCFWLKQSWKFRVMGSSCNIKFRQPSISISVFSLRFCFEELFCSKRYSDKKPDEANLWLCEESQAYSHWKPLLC